VSIHLSIFVYLSIFRLFIDRRPAIASRRKEARPAGVRAGIYFIYFLSTFFYSWFGEASWTSFMVALSEASLYHRDDRPISAVTGCIVPAEFGCIDSRGRPSVEKQGIATAKRSRKKRANS
jgi:hypothetical protein